MRLLERDGALATLRQLREESSREGRLVFLEGEAGVGKTSLLRAIRRDVPAGTRVLLGACDPLSTPRPFGPIVDVAEALDPDLAGLIRDGAPRDAILQQLLGSLRAGRGALVLLLDDLHWADEATLDTLRFIGRRIESARALVVGTYRDDEVGREHPLRVVVGDLATSPAVRRLPLRPLSLGAVEELASGTDLDPGELHRQTGGNPFFVTEVVAAAPARIPATVRDAVLARVARLSPNGRATLEAAAVIGPATEHALLARVVEHPAPQDSLARGLLQTDGRQYAFRHELARQAILLTLDPETRIDLHARVLRALETGPSEGRPAALLAHHAEEAGDRDATVRYAREAARDATAAGAHREVAAQLARAVRHAGGLTDGDRAQLLHESARALATIARFDLALPVYAEAEAIWREADDVSHQVAVLTDQAKGFVSMARNDEAEATARRALELVQPLAAGPEKTEAINTYAYLRMLDRDNADAIELGRQAIALGTGDPRAIGSVIQAWNTVGAARILIGDLGGIGDLEKSRALALERGLDRPVASAYAVCASALGEIYRFDVAEPWFEDGLRFTTERDLDANRLYLEAWSALALLYRGQWERAGALANAVIAGPARGSIGGIMALLALGRLRARRGDPDAWQVLDEALELANRTGTLQRVGPVRAARAEAAWLAGDPARAAEEAAAAFDLARAKAHPWHIGELGWWQRQARESFRPDTTGAAEPWRLQLAGESRAASAAWLALDCPYEAARALLESDDVDALREAHSTFDRLGAGPAAALAVRRLRELGATSVPRGRRASTRANAAGVTQRELEVLRLVATGLPNHEIAARLFLSPRTVDHHVSAVLGKLGVARRSDVAAAAARAGIEVAMAGAGSPPGDPKDGQVAAPD